MTAPAFHPGPHFIRRRWDALPEDERAAAIASIPDGWLVRLTAGYPGQPGTATVRVIRDGRLLGEARGQLTIALVRHALARAAVPA